MSQGYEDVCLGCALSKRPNPKGRAQPKNLQLLTAVLFKERCFGGFSAWVQTGQNFLVLTVSVRNVSMKSIKDPLSKEEKYSKI